jgi:hypothetical protein
MTAPQRDQLGDPPVQQAAVNYSLVINLKTAKARARAAHVCLEAGLAADQVRSRHQPDRR